MRKAAVAVGIALLLMGVVEAKAEVGAPSENDNKQLRKLCIETTSTRLPNGSRRNNPQASNRCYAQAINKLDNTSVYVDGGEVYKEYKRTGPVKTTRTTTYKSEMKMVDGVYTNVTTVDRHPKEFSHQRKVITLD